MVLAGMLRSFEKQRNPACFFILFYIILFFLFVFCFVLFFLFHFFSDYFCVAVMDVTIK